MELSGAPRAGRQKVQPFPPRLETRVQPNIELGMHEALERIEGLGKEVGCAT